MSDQQVFNSLLRSSFNAFARKAFQSVYPGTPFQPNWHIEAITHHLSQCHTGQMKRLLIAQPPRSLKSFLTAVAFAAWEIGHDPSRRIFVVSYSNELAEELARLFRRIIEEDWYRQAFPKVRIVKNTAVELVTDQGGGRLALSVGGSITGRGADIIIIDDPQKAEEVYSDVSRKSVIGWYRNTLYSRLNDKENGAIILVQQRLHEEDLTGYLMEQGGFNQLVLPAIALRDERIRIGDGPNGFYERKKGEALQPDRESLETLLRIEREIGPLAFSTQYQQQPIPFEGNILQKSWLHSYDELPSKNGPRVQSWDLSYGLNEKSDYSVGTEWFIHGGKAYLTDLIRFRRPYPETCQQIRNFAKARNAFVVIIEKSGPGISLLQEFWNDEYGQEFDVHGLAPLVSKEERLVSALPMIASGQIVFPRTAPWLDSYLKELLAFPSSKNDDQVDSTTQFIRWFQTHGDHLETSMVGGIAIPRNDGYSRDHFGFS